MSYLLGKCTCGSKATDARANTYATPEVAGSPPLQRSHSSTVRDAMEYQPDPSHYKLHVVIGRGSLDRATIYLGEHLPTNSQVAVRIVKLDLYTDDFYFLQDEILAAKQLHHANILPYLCTFVNDDQIWIVMPMMGYGSCKDLIHAHFADGLPEPAIAFILRDVLQAADYLHGSGHIHRSIRASHVLISADGHVCLTGLRASTSLWYEGRKLQALHELPQTNLISVNWLAPEVLQQDLNGYGTKSDMYSLGILACELANGVVPFADMAPTQMLLEKVEGAQPQLIDSTTAVIEVVEDDKPEQEEVLLGDGERSEREVKTLPVARTFSPHFHDLVDKCLRRDPAERPSASQLLGHSFFKRTRRRSIDSLPQLLYPVAPLKNINHVPRDNSIPDCLAEDLHHVTLNDEAWVF